MNSRDASKTAEMNLVDAKWTRADRLSRARCPATLVAGPVRSDVARRRLGSGSGHVAGHLRVRRRTRRAS